MAEDNVTTLGVPADERKQRQVETVSALLQAKMDETVDSALEEFAEIVDAGASRMTKNRERKNALLEDESDAANQRIDERHDAIDVTPSVPARRATITPCSDYRYNTLPEYLRGVRTPETDRTIFRYLNALAEKDITVLREIAVQDRQDRMRADLTVGAPTAPGGPFDGTGGQLVPLVLGNVINTVLYKNARMRSISAVFQSSSNNLRLPNQGQGSTTTWTAEAGALTQGEPTYDDALNLVKKKLTNLSIITNELLMDAAFAVASWVTDDVGRNMAAEEDEKMYGSGNGILEPSGFEAQETAGTNSPFNMLPRTAEGQTGGNGQLAAPISYQNMVDLFYLLQENARRNGVWMAPDAVLAHLSVLVDGNGRPIFAQMNDPGRVVGDSLSGSETSIGTIFGKPVYSMPGVELDGTSSGDGNRLYFAEMDMVYAILDGGEIRAEASRDAGFANDTTHFRFVHRVDGGLWDSSARRYVYTNNINGAT